ncbi:MAG TPA: hypothetical protein VGM05_02850, partial [Planctomycetaceae bacterium]
MTLTLRQRILLTIVPLLVIVAVLGSAGVALLLRLGNSAGAILRENYDSVIAMQRLNEALERIDSALQFMLNARDDEELRNKAKDQYDLNWEAYRQALEVERNNITLDGEGELVSRLQQLSGEYRSLGDDFFSKSPGTVELRQEYFRQPGGLLSFFNAIKTISGDILRLNQ